MPLLYFLIPQFLMYNNLIFSGFLCDACGGLMNLKNCFKVKDGIAWECTVSFCRNYRRKISIRKNSFSEKFNLTILEIIKILIKWACDQPQHSIIKQMEIDPKTYREIILSFLDITEAYDNDVNKFGGPGKIVHVDETGLDFKVKSHRGRAPENKTDALCIIEYDTSITRAFSCVISDKKASTFLPIICEKVERGSIIHTDEHKSYSKLNHLGFVHNTVYHEYNFLNRENGVNTQAVESFNNELCLDIKRRKEY
jgi:transposase-like protein